MAATRTRKATPSGKARARKPAPASKKTGKVSASPVPAVLVCGATVRAEALREAFAPLCGPKLRLVDAPGLLAGRGENGPVLVLVSAPLRFVAARLEEGLAPAAALEAWRDITAQIGAMNKARRKIVLLDDRALAAPDPGLREELARRLGFEIALPGVSAPAVPAGPASALAYALLATDAELMAPVEAWQQDVLGAEGTGFGRDDAWLAAQAWQPETSQAGVQRAALLQEISAQQVGQIEEATRRIAGLEAQLAQRAGEQAETAVLRASLEALERRLAESEARRARLEAALGAQILADGAELAEARAQMDEVRTELERILRSKSWKVAKVLRVSRRVLRR